MVFDESVVVRTNVGQRIFAGQLVACRFGPNQLYSLICISQTLDKLIVHETSTAIKLNTNEEFPPVKESNFLESDHNGLLDNDSPDSSSIYMTLNSLDCNQAIYFITIKDVIKSLAVKRGSKNNFINHIERQNYDKDILIIGCSSSIFIYDTMTQSNLISIRISNSINYITNDKEMTICGGDKKIYALRIEQIGGNFLSENQCNQLNAEITSEKSTSDTISCIIQGHFQGKDLIVTGSGEDKNLCIYYLESFDGNIQTCQLTIEENSAISCLCAINTVDGSSSADVNPVENSDVSDLVQQSKQLKRENSTLLPSFESQQVENNENPLDREPISCNLFQEQMSFFAFGLENGSIGVRRLVMISTDMSMPGGQAPTSQSPSLPVANSQKSIQTERLWRHKAKQQPLTMLMYDINGDGFEELLIGYKNSRLEARSPFTGQLLAVTRCFKARERLAGLTILMGKSFELTTIVSSEQHREKTINTNEAQGILVACSTNGSLIGFKPQRITGSRQPLRSFNFSSASQRASLNYNKQPLSADLQAEDWTTSLKASLAPKAQIVASPTMDNNDQRQSSPPHSTISSSLLPSSVTLDGNKRSGIKGDAMARGTDLHIELRGDDTMAGQCEAKQSADLLHRLSDLRNEQMELEKRACQIYSATMHHVVTSITSQQLDDYQTTLTSSMMTANNVNISHSWDFDATTLRLRLFIVVASKLNEQVEMLELEDESRNFLPTGQLIVGSQNCGGGKQASSNNQLDNNNLYHTTSNNFLAIVLLRSKRDHETQLNLRIYCSLKNKQSENFNDRRHSHRHSSLKGREKLFSRIYETIIQVPQFAMFALASSASCNSKLPDRSDGTKMLRMTFKLDNNDSTRLQQQQQVLDYLNENFLCLRFGSQAAAIGLSSLASSSSFLIKANQYHHRQSTASWLSNVSSSRDSTTASIQEENLSSILATRRSTSASDCDQVASSMPPRRTDGSQPEDEVEIELRFVDIRQTILNRQQQSAKITEHDNITTEASNSKKLASSPLGATNNNNKTLDQHRDQISGMDADANRANQVDSMLRVALSNGKLELECENLDLLVNLVRFLVIDRLQFRISGAELANGSNSSGGNRSVEQLSTSKNTQTKLGPLLHDLNAISRVKELEESETRIQSELYESADYTKNLMQQFAIANQLNEFSIAKELLNELSMMLTGAFNAAQAHYLNNKKRHELTRDMDQLKEKVLFLTGQSN